MASTPQHLEIVLDTNVVLDWLLFKEPSAAFIHEAVTSGAWRWVATQPMLDELRHELGRSWEERWRIHAAPALMFVDDLCQVVQTDSPSLAARLVCSDPDDQKFIDLALQRNVDLLTKDRALLRLAKRARLRGIQVKTPRDWKPRGV